MAYREEDIKYEKDVFTVILECGVHKVLVNGITHATSIVAFEGDADGLSIAKAYVDYLVKHASVESIAEMAGTFPSTILALRTSLERRKSQWNTNTTLSGSNIETVVA